MHKPQKPLLTGKHSTIAKVTIDASQEAVWSLLSDFNNVQDWAPSVIKSHGLGNKAIGVGAGRHCKLEGFGDIDEYITQYFEGHGFVYDVTPLGPLNKSYSRWWLTRKNNSTELEVEFCYNLRFGLFGKLMHFAIMKNKIASSLAETLQAVKAEVEKRKQSKIQLAAVA